MPTLSRLICFVAAMLLVAGCTTTPRQQATLPALVVQPPPHFNIAASELDTWNAVGQLLVRMEGVTYEGRAQKLGLYAVEYRGEKFLIFTRALLLSSEIKNLTTEVRTALQNGKPNSSAPAIELLGMLQARLPAELVRIESEKKAAQAKKHAPKKKKTAKPAVRG